MSGKNPGQQALSYDELLQQVQTLRREVEELKAERQDTWDLFAETGRKLQIYSASIKAAVSSLLSYDIFWDSANQHEFLVTISNSVNQVSDLTVLQTLAFRAEAGSLVLKRDTQMLQEILSGAQANAVKKWPDLKLEVTFPPEGKPVLADYEYLNNVLLLFIEVFFPWMTGERILIAASEGNSHWYLDFAGADPSIFEMIDQMHRCKIRPAKIGLLSTENVLRLHIACEILHLQEVAVQMLDEPGRPPTLRLSIPAVVTARID